MIHKYMKKNRHKQFLKINKTKNIFNEFLKHIFKHLEKSKNAKYKSHV